MDVHPTQRHAMISLRQSGMGYKAIASLLGFHRDQVRAITTTVTVTGNLDETLPRCRWCGEPISLKRRGRPASFCCEDHRRAWWACHPEFKQQSAVYHFTCAGCGKPFVAYGNRGRKYCSQACYVAHRSRTW